MHVVLLALLAFIAIWVVALVDIATQRDIGSGQRLVLALLLIFVWPIGVAGWLVLRGPRLRRHPIMIASVLLASSVIAVGLWASVALVAGHSSVEVRAVRVANVPAPTGGGGMPLTNVNRRQALAIASRDQTFALIVAPGYTVDQINPWQDNPSSTSLRGAQIAITLSSPIAYFDAMLPMPDSAGVVLPQAHYVGRNISKFDILVDFTRQQVLRMQPAPGSDITPLGPKSRPSTDQ